MNLELAPSDEQFKQDARSFLETYLSDELKRETARSAGVWADFDTAMKWQKILYEHGRIAPSWPKAFGGNEWSLVERFIWEEECARAGAPRIPAMGLRMCGPVLIEFGTEEQKARFLPKILSGEDFWCQGYSEPAAGSDLAALQCKAESDGDDYIINGTKIWTTYAQFANWIFCLVRTDSSGKPQQGITFILIPMDTPGISITPIITLAGDHEVNSVFFDNVRVPKSLIVGQEHDGWSVAKYLLEHERGGAFASGMRRKLDELKTFVRSEYDGPYTPSGVDPIARRIAELEVDLLSLEVTERRVFARMSDGSGGAADPSFLKLAGTELTQKIDELFVEAVEHYAFPDFLEARVNRTNLSVGPDGAIPVMGQYLNNRAATIYGGSSEVQRNIMSKILFGL